MIFKTDTIAAISTAPGEAGIAIIRLSGPQSLAVADRIFKCRLPRPSKRKAPAMVYGHVVDNGKVIDEAILLIMKAPHSYTCEDAVEFQCHGGTIASQRILRTILKNNVRPAEPGEFTKRAFLNGRIDLLQAEAVLDIIRAQTDKGADIAIEQLNGRLSYSLIAIYNDTLRACSDIEASLDFIEDELPPSFYKSIQTSLRGAERKIQALLKSYDEGHIIKDGALVVITGKTNVGKSSLLNAILGKERVIVSPVPGTTRDIIEEYAVIKGIPVRLVDTAGLRHSKCEIEKEGVRRAMDVTSGADLILYVIDGSKRLSNNELDSIRRIHDNGKIVLIVKNKTDLGNVKLPDSLKKYPVVHTQLIYNKEVAQLTKMVASKIHTSKRHISNVVISERHRHILMTAGNLVNEAIDMMKKSDESFLAVIAQKLREASEQIGSLTGKNFYQEMLNSIFNRFCVGK